MTNTDYFTSRNGYIVARKSMARMSLKRCLFVYEHCKNYNMVGVLLQNLRVKTFAKTFGPNSFEMQILPYVKIYSTCQYNDEI